MKQKFLKDDGSIEEGEPLTDSQASMFEHLTEYLHRMQAFLSRVLGKEAMRGGRKAYHGRNHNHRSIGMGRSLRGEGASSAA